MEKETKKYQTDFYLAKEYIAVNIQLRKDEAILAKHHTGLTYDGLISKKKELKALISSLSKIASTMLSRGLIDCKKDHFKVLSKCEQIIKDQ